MLTRSTLFVCSFAVCALAQTPAQTPAQAPATGSIEGQVFNAKTGVPLKRATVRLVGQSMQGNFAGAGAAPMPIPAQVSAEVAQAMAAVPNQAGRMPLMMNKETDEQGKFVFTGLTAGKYRISVERQGFLRQSYGAKKYPGGSAAVAVGDGQAVKGIDVRLQPQGVVVGKALDEDGEPVA